MAYEINCTPLECVKLRRKHNSDLLDWATEVMAIYGCRPTKGDSDNLREFVADVFAAGRISGVREVRRRRKHTEPALSPVKADLERLTLENPQLAAVVIHELLQAQAEHQEKQPISSPHFDNIPAPTAVE